MKLKKVFSSIVALIMCLPLIPSLKSAQTAYAEIMGSYISWQEAYYQALLNFQSTNTYKSKENYGIQCSKYDLYDIDQNGTPELIISEGEFHTAECIVYTFYNSQLIKLNTFNMTYGVLYVNPDNNYLIFRDSHMLNDTTICYTLSNGQLNQKINLHKADNGSVTIDNITVSKSKYDSEIGKYYNSSIMQIGRKNDFGYFAFYENYKATTTTTTKRTTTTTKTTTTTTTTKRTTTTTTTRRIITTTTTTKRTTTTTKTATTAATTTTTPKITTKVYTNPNINNDGISYQSNQLDAESAKSKPFLVVDKKIISSADDAQGQIVTVNFVISGENVDKNYCATGLHINWDKRLTAIEQKDGKLCIMGEAAANLTEEEVAYSNGVFLTTMGENDLGSVGKLFSISFRLPDDAQEGDVYPIDIAYQTKEKLDDLFTNNKNDESGQIMQKWFFTKGTFSSDNPSDDPYLVKVNAEFADGYIAVDFNDTTTSTTTIPELSLNKTNITLANGDQYTIIPNRKDVTFKTNNSDVAVVSSQGVITAVGIGSATISVIDSESNVVQIKITVTSVITEESTTGDVNNDNIIDSRDASAVLREYAASSTETGGSFTNEQKKAADINGDNIIDSRDASLILMFYAQASTENGEQSIENFIKKFK